MPFVGRSPLEGVAEAYAGGRAAGLQRQALKQQEARDQQAFKVQEAQLKLAQQDMERRIEADKRAMQQEERMAQQAALRTTALEFDMRRQAKADRRLEAQRATELGMEPARLAMHERALRSLVSEHPELEAEARGMARVLETLPDAESRRLFLDESTPALVMQANQLAARKATGALRTAMRRGFLSPEGGDDPQFAGLVESTIQGIESGQMKPDDGFKLLLGRQKEMAEDEADVETRQMATQTLKATYSPLVQADPEMGQAVLSLINGYKRGVGTYKEVVQQITDLLAARAAESKAASAADQRQADMRTRVYSETPAVDDMGDPLPPGQRARQAQEAIDFGEGRVQTDAAVDLTPDDIAIVKAVRAKNPQATDAEIDAAIANARRRREKGRPTTR